MTKKTKQKKRAIEVEHPPEIMTKPLDRNNQDDRIRDIFGLRSADPLPGVNFETLEIYRDYLAKQLSFPFEAVRETFTGAFSSAREPVIVIGFGDPNEESRLDDLYGLICEIKTHKWRGDAPLDELQAKGEGRNQQLLADYCFWFWNHREDRQ